MKLQLIRHATIKLQFNKLTILVDPMFSLKGTLAAVGNAANDYKNPLVELFISIDEVLKDVDAVIVTHSHRDHFDDRAIQLLPKDVPLFCQPDDEEKLLSYGFKQVISVKEKKVWRGIELTRTGGQHGTGELGKQMGPVSGFMLEAKGEPLVFIAGDTIWCPDVEEAITRYLPEIIILNGGEAQFLTGDPITMGCSDIEKVSKASPSSKIVVVHMEAWNHCLLSRKDLVQYIEDHHLQNVMVPEDGRQIEY